MAARFFCSYIVSSSFVVVCAATDRSASDICAGHAQGDVRKRLILILSSSLSFTHTHTHTLSLSLSLSVCLSLSPHSLFPVLCHRIFLSRILIYLPFLLSLSPNPTTLGISCLRALVGASLLRSIALLQHGLTQHCGLWSVCLPIMLQQRRVTLSPRLLRELKLFAAHLKAWFFKFLHVFFCCLCLIYLCLQIVEYLIV